jgi:uncharacterized protein YndB with AHSA1/START domain
LRIRRKERWRCPPTASSARSGSTPPIDVVRSVLTEPEQITQWFSDSADLELRPGADGTLTFRGSRKGSRPDDSQELVVNLRVERVEPPRLFSFR